jgi:hypothetical protein
VWGKEAGGVTKHEHSPSEGEGERRGGEEEEIGGAEMLSGQVAAEKKLLSERRVVLLELRVVVRRGRCGMGPGGPDLSSGFCPSVGGAVVDAWRLEQLDSSRRQA